VLIVENYRSMSRLGLVDTLLGIELSLHGERVRSSAPSR